MLTITNISSVPQRFTVKGGKRVEIAPGESAGVAMARDNMRVTAKERAGLITVSASQPRRAKAGMKKPRARKAASPSLE